ncbi:MAG TPA: hypothetical protein VMW09_00270 [Desulfatiglandales bacterium]|nr:hypothetical protein [Desulfatiglandales bacterium]
MDTKNNGRLKVSRKIIDLIKGLRTLSDLDDCYWLLKHLSILARLIDDIASDDVEYDMPNVSIADLTFYQQEIIGKVEDVLKAQDDTIAELKSIIYKAEKAAGIPFMDKRLEVNERKLTALTSLKNVFNSDFGVSVSNYEGLKAWALTYNFDFETVKKLIGAEEISE